MSEHHSIGKFLNLARLEPLIGIALVCHGTLMLSQLGGKTDQWALICLVALLSLLAFLPQFKTKNSVQARAISYTLITAYLILTTGASKSFFLLWYFVIISYYPLVLGAVCGASLIIFISLFYLSTLIFQTVGLPASVVIARTVLLTFIGVLSFNLSYRLRSFDALEVLASTDSLTGLKNRRYFFELANLEFTRSQRYDSNLCMVIADIDNFKHINDTFGHAQGDEALKLCADILTKGTRNIDIVCRLGGDEFAILLPNTDWMHAKESVKRLQYNLSNAQSRNTDTQIKLNMSFGLAEISDSVNDITELYKNADLDMYKHKSKSHKKA